MAFSATKLDRRERQGCQIFIGKVYQITSKIYQMAMEIPKWLP
jgi:hypothetical protein